MFAAGGRIEELMTPFIDRTPSSPVEARAGYSSADRRYTDNNAADDHTARLWRRVEAASAAGMARMRELEQAHAEEVRRIKAKYRGEIGTLEKRLLEQENAWKQTYDATLLESKMRREAETTLDRWEQRRGDMVLDVAAVNERVLEMEVNQQRRIQELSGNMNHTLNALKEKEALRRSELEQRLLEAERHFEMKAQRYDALVLELRRTVESQRLQYEQRIATLQQELAGKNNIVRDRQEALEALEKELWATQHQVTEAERKYQSAVAVHAKKEEKWRRRVEKLAMKFAQVQGQSVAAALASMPTHSTRETDSQASVGAGFANDESPRWQRGRKKSDYGLL